MGLEEVMNPKTGSVHHLPKRRAVFVTFSPDIKNHIKPKES